VYKLTYPMDIFNW